MQNDRYISHDSNKFCWKQKQDTKSSFSVDVIFFLIIAGNILENWQGMTTYGRRLKKKIQMKKCLEGEIVSIPGIGGNAKTGIRFYGEGSNFTLEVKN